MIEFFGDLKVDALLEADDCDKVLVGDCKVDAILEPDEELCVSVFDKVVCKLVVEMSDVPDVDLDEVDDGEEFKVFVV